MSHTIKAIISLCDVGLLWLTFLCQVGLLYDEVSLQNVLDMIADWTPEDIQNLRNMVMKNITKHLSCGKNKMQENVFVGLALSSELGLNS